MPNTAIDQARRQGKRRTTPYCSTTREFSPARIGVHAGLWPDQALRVRWPSIRTITWAAVVPQGCKSVMGTATSRPC
jgi:hypothetical protein